MRRRDLLKAAAFTPLAMAGCGGGSAETAGATTPQQPPTQPTSAPPPGSGGSPIQPPSPPPATDGNLINLGLAMNAAGAQPFTVGQIFRKGDVPSGTAITLSTAQFQVDVRNRWSDGSVRFAVISGVAPAGTVVIRKGGTPFSGVNVAEPAVEATVKFADVVDATGAPVAGGAFTADIAAARAAGLGPWSRTAPRKVREILGPVMSEFHYFVPTADTHTHVWFYVRSYSTGQVEVETVVQNGWTQVANPGRRTYGVAVSIGGSTRYTGIGVAHYHHTRWSRVDWIGTNPRVTPSPDRAYLRSTGMLPQMTVTSLQPTVYTTQPEGGQKYSAWTPDLAEQPIPFDTANIDPQLGAGGFTDNVGTFPAWDMTWLAEGDARAYWSVIGNGRASGVFPAFYSDETTGRPIRKSSYPTLGLNSTGAGLGEASGNAPLLTPAPTGGVSPFGNGGFSWSHGPKMGYLAYLLTGRWTFLESVEHYSAAAGLLKHNAMYDGYPYPAWWMQPRSWGHILDWWGKSAQIAPQYINGVVVSGAEADQQAEAQGRWTSSIKRYWHQLNPSGTPDPGALDYHYRDNALGAWYHNTFDEAEGNTVEHSGQQWGFIANAWLWNYVAEAPTTELAKLEDMVRFTSRLPIGMMGASVTNPWGDYRLSHAYSIVIGIGPREGPQTPFASWKAAWDWLNASTWRSGTNPIPTLPVDTALRRFSTEGAVSNVSGPLGSLAAVSSDTNAFVWAMAGMYEANRKISGGLAGAKVAADRFYGSSSWKASVAAGGFDLFAGCAVLPSGYSLSTATVPTSNTVAANGLPYAIPAANNVVAIGTLPVSIKPSDWGRDNWHRSLFDSFGGGTFVPTYSTHGAYVLAGTGGHNHPDHIGAAVFNFATAEWERLDVANSGTFKTAGAPYTDADSNGEPYYEVGAPYYEVPAPPHPYATLAYMPSGTKGSVIYVTRGATLGVLASTRDSRAVHRFDLATRRWSRVAMSPIPTGEGTAVWDAARNRWWLIPQALHSGDYSTRTIYLDGADLTFKTIESGIYFSSATSVDGTVAPRTVVHDTYLLRNAGPTGGLWLYDPNAPTRVDANGFAGWNRVNVSGTLPDAQCMWARYSNGNWYSFPGVTGTGDTANVYRIRPPADVKNGTWLVDQITLNAQLPQHASYNGLYQAKHYTRLFYVPAIDCLAWIPGADKQVYIFKPGS